MPPRARRPITHKPYAYPRKFQYLGPKRNQAPVTTRTQGRQSAVRSRSGWGAGAARRAEGRRSYRPILTTHTSLSPAAHAHTSVLSHRTHHPLTTHTTHTTPTPHPHQTSDARHHTPHTTHTTRGLTPLDAPSPCKLQAQCPQPGHTSHQYTSLAHARRHAATSAHAAARAHAPCLRARRSLRTSSPLTTTSQSRRCRHHGHRCRPHRTSCATTCCAESLHLTGSRSQAVGLRSILPQKTACCDSTATRAYAAARCQTKPWQAPYLPTNRERVRCCVASWSAATVASRAAATEMDAHLKHYPPAIVAWAPCTTPSSRSLQASPTAQECSALAPS